MSDLVEPMSCGSRLMALLRAYGVDTVFGMPGVHTLEAYRGMTAAGIRHIGVRHEQGAGFMADGYARMSGKPGVCLVISGPGVTNVATPVGQAWSDSIPILVLSSVAATDDLGMGRGRLHEITDQARVTEAITALSATATGPDQVREYLARAFALFASGRRRPVHLSIPLDVLVAPDARPVVPRLAGGLKTPSAQAIQAAADLLADAGRVAIIAGGGSLNAASALSQLAETLGAAVAPTIAGKGVMDDNHPLVLDVTLDRQPTQSLLAQSDVVICIGTELAEPDLWLSGPLPFRGKLIRIDIDPAVLVRDYDVDVAIEADADATLRALNQALASRPLRAVSQAVAVASVRTAERAGLTPLEQLHLRVLASLRRAIPPDGVIYADMTQLAYTGYAFYPCPAPRRWFFPAGFGTLGYALPAAIGGQIAAPGTPVMVIVGDGGLQFTVQELGTAVEQQLPLVIILWNNNSLAQIRDGMVARDIPTIGVNQHNPDFIQLGQAWGCHTSRPQSLDELENEIAQGFTRHVPTLIELCEQSAFLQQDDA